MIDRLQTWTAALLDWAEAPWRQAALVTLLSLAVLIPGLAGLPVTDRDEARFAQASKQMIETGDLVDIRFQDQPRWKKPAGIYWLQAASASLFGGAGAPISAYRLPSVLGAWLAALCTLWAAQALIGRREALAAGAIMATTILLAAEGHIAKTDAALAATAAAAMGGLAHTVIGQRAWAAWVFWIAIAVSILLKGPIVPVIAIITVAALWWRPVMRPHLARLRPLWGLLLVAAATAPWLVAIWIRTDGAFFTEALGRDMGAKIASGQEKHWGPPGLYLALVWVTFWPWAALIPHAAANVWRRPWTIQRRFLVAWLVPFWLVLEAVPTKLPHYVLPLYPALAMLVAAYAVAPVPASRWINRLSAILLAVPGLAIVLGVIALPWLPDVAGIGGAALIPIQVSPGAMLLALMAAAVLVVAIRAAWRGARLAQITASVAAALLLYPAILAFALPAARTAFPSPALAALIAQYRPCASGPAFTIGYNEPSLVFLTETALRTARPGPALQALANDPGALVLIEDRWIDIVGPLPPHIVRASVTYFNPNRGNMATARLVTPDHARWSACAK